MRDRVLRYMRRTLLILGPLVCLLIVGAVLVYVLSPAADIWLVWKVYARYVDTISNLTGFNTYLVTALALVAFVPFYYAVTLVLYHPFTPRLRWRGITILLILAVTYNVSLYYVTRDLTFGFKTDKALRYYALTPDGVKFYDRPGVDTTYGVALQPVTPENVVDLLAMSRGEFRRLDDRGALSFFNPRTGAAMVWYFKHDDGALEFYNQPGFHPGTGRRLLPATEMIYREWVAADMKRRTYEREQAAQRKAEQERQEAERQRIQIERGARIEAECRKLAAGRRSSADSDSWGIGTAWASSNTFVNVITMHGMAVSTGSIYNSAPRDSVVIDGVRVPCP